MIRLLWLVTVGVPLSLALNLLGVLFCLTIVGIPRSVRNRVGDRRIRSAGEFRRTYGRSPHVLMVGAAESAP